MERKVKISKALTVIMLGAGLAVMSCSKESSNGNGDKIDPNTIAPTNLVAYFPFENSGADAVSGLTPVELPNVGYVNGQRGMAFQGVEGAYFLYNLPAGHKLTNLKAFTLSMWFYGPQAPQNVDPVPGIIQISGTSDPVWGNMMLTQDRMPENADSLNIKLVFHKEGAVWNNQFVGFSKPAFTENLWIHLVFTYDNTTSKYMVYVNGDPLTLSPDITDRWAAPPEVNPRPPLGDLAFAGATQFAIGGWVQKIKGEANEPWMGNFTGQIDELRIFDRGLTAQEVKSLFEAEVSQLN